MGIISFEEVMIILGLLGALGIFLLVWWLRVRRMIRKHEREKVETHLRPTASNITTGPPRMPKLWYVTCATCQKHCEGYFNHYDGSGTILSGECRNNPVQVVLVDSKAIRVCYDWKPIEEAKRE